jgi:hypothetical protein
MVFVLRFGVVRIQVRVTAQQLEALRQVAATTGRPVADLIRESVDQFLAGRGELSRTERIERAIGIAGRFSSGRTDVSANHDKYLAEAFGE